MPGTDTEVKADTHNEDELHQQPEEHVEAPQEEEEYEVRAV